MSGTFAATLQSIIDDGNGLAAEFLGVPFTSYRCTQNVSGDFANWYTPVAAGTQLVRKVRITDQKIENAVKSSGTVFYSIVGDMSANLVGDVFVCTDPAFVDGQSYGAGATSFAGDTSGDFDGFAIVWRPPVGKAVGARVNRLIRIFRATASATDPDNETSWDVTSRVGRPQALVLTNGSYAFQAGAAGSLIPAGFGSSERPAQAVQFGGKTGGNDPATTQAPRGYLFIPAIPGYYPQEADIILDINGNRYVTVQPFYQATGVAGSQCVIERSYAGAK